MTKQPLTEEQARAMQKAWADHLGFEVAYENSIGMQLRVIPPGTFRMRSRPRAEVGPVEVTLSQAFLIGQFEVTQGEWKRVMGPIESMLDAGVGDRFPMYRVNHAEATEFCRKLTKLEREAGKLPRGYEYRLPTAAEREFACRAGTLTRHHFGDKMSSRLANYDGSRPLDGTEKGPNLGRTVEVGSYPANAWGLHDMHGNLTEWCMDWYHHKVEGGVDPVQLQPSTLNTMGMVIRGSAWRSSGQYCRSAHRWHAQAQSRRSTIGFRPVLTKVQHGKVVAFTQADDSVKPEPVVMTEQALTTEQAQTAQKAWAEHLGFDVAFENSIGMKLRVVPPGTYRMGTPADSKMRKDNEDVAEVTLSQAFLIGQYELTQGAWERVMGPIDENTKRGMRRGGGDRFPIHGINHAEAREFCRKLTQLDRKAGVLPEGYEYRLPTGAEWEYACRAGTLTHTHFGNTLSSHQANFDGARPFNNAGKGPNLDRAAEVGSYPANAWGLHDMHGNMLEWCLDWYHHMSESGVDPVNREPAKNRLIKSCRWGYTGFHCKSANRYWNAPDKGASTIGFRPVLTKLQFKLENSPRPDPIDKPLTSEEARAAQKVSAERLGLDVGFENSIGMQLRLIPPGTFRMGSLRDEVGRQGYHETPLQVTHSKAFFIGRYEVTQSEWERVMGPIPTSKPRKAGTGDRFPVYHINYAEAGEFCQKLTQLDHEAGKLPKGYEYRLPTDAEWEYACRAGTVTATHFGNKLSSKQANFNGVDRPYNGAEKGPYLSRTAEVGSYPANAWGLHDMHGNLSEWCLDSFQPTAKGGVDPVQVKPTSKRVIRDSQWNRPGQHCRSASRSFSSPENRGAHLGFRPVLTKVQHGKVAAITHADDPAMPEPVVMMEQPLTTEQAQTAQKAWADHLGVDAIVKNAIGIQLSVIPPGTFPMGIANFKKVEPQDVTHTQPFFIGRYEVTQGEWERVMGRAVGWQQKTGVGDRIPAYGINYAEAVEFCWKLTELDRKAGKLPEGYEYRLPTTAELEFACRAGTLTATYFGDTLSSMQANFDGGRPYNGAENGPFLNRLTEVGSYPGNAWGLHDTHGNLAEWCLDWYHNKPKGGVDPVHLLPSPEHSIPQRVDKGGRYLGPGRYCLSSNRYFHLPEDRAIGLGLRPVLSRLNLDGLHRPTYGRHSDFNQAWTRDGTNLRIWHKWNHKDRFHYVMSGSIDNIPGTTWATALTSPSYHTWAYTCLTDGRILVRSNPPNQELGYYLMTPNKNAPPKFEPIQCELATKGVLDRISLSPSETKVCFEFQTGFEDNVPGRTLYVAEFDAKQPAITGAKPFANEGGKPIWYAFPRWSKDESAIVYQAGGKLYLYNLANKSTTKMSTTDPHVKRAPK